MCLRERWSQIVGETLVWCRGRNWLVRSPILLGFVYILIRSLADPMYFGILGPLNLGIHELGHFLFGFFGIFICVLGGTFWEIAAPFFGMWNFYRQKDFFAITLCFGWLSTALFHVATYVADARVMELPLVTPFGADPAVAHDWNYILGQVGFLPYDFAVAFFIRILAVGAMAVCLGSGGWLLYQMMITGEKVE